MAPRQEEWVALNGLNVHLTLMGDRLAEPVVFLHGFPELAESWRDVMATAAGGGFFAVAPDLRGYGGTSRPATGYDIQTLAADVVALIDHVGAPVHLVGHDWGGAIAYEVSASFPDRVRTLAIVNAPHPQVMAQRVWQPRQLLRSWYMLFFQLPWLPERYVSRGRGRGIASRMRLSAVDATRFTDERLAPYVAAFATPERARPPIEYYRAAFRGLFRRRPNGQAYPRIRAPFRLIWSLRDRALGPELTRNLEPYFEHPVEVHYLEDVGHCAPIEAPERVADLLVAFWRAQPRPRT